jgi:hypothetical protein
VAPDAQPGQSPGSPQDALEELVRAVAAPAGPTPDPDVALAFAAGWHAGEAIEAAHDGGKERIVVLCAQLRADTARLGKRLDAVGGSAGAIDDAVTALASAPADRGAATALAATLGAQLLAADFRLGKGFSVGQGIAGLFARGHFDATAFRHDLLEGHDKLQDQLSQLATALPPNAGHSVKDSLNMWRHAVSSGERLGDLHETDVTRQGEAWRSLLSGEKAGKDALELTDYVGVAEAMAGEIRGLALRALRSMWRYLLVILALVVLGVAGIVVWQHTAGSAAGIASLLAAVGLTWKGLGGSLGRAVARVEQPAWDAQVDRAIAYAITHPLPGALIADAADGTLLAGLRKWRHDHARPRDQGAQGAPREP